LFSLIGKREENSKSKEDAVELKEKKRYNRRYAEREKNWNYMMLSSPLPMTSIKSVS
jgi:hypothetical protein